MALKKQHLFDLKQPDPAKSGEGNREVCQGEVVWVREGFRATIGFL